jgi:hypothetical protein
MATNLLDYDSIFHQARARIFWGRPPAEVREWVLSQGISEAHADLALETYLKERAEAFRRIGARCLSRGLILLAGAAAICLLLLGNGTPPGRGVWLCGLAAMLGLWQVIKGLEVLIRGPQSDRSIRDL